MKLTLLPNHNMIIQKGFDALEKALQFYPIIRNKQCGQCNGSCTQISKANYHIFIELDIRASLQMLDVGNVCTNEGCRCRRFPQIAGTALF
ncbi:unnamed protein product [Lasius platythorax]|uniref:Uncharacterized protein n=1 Tax=Lasius platythorax TaxID=488582 RepID=A0AAV2MYE5_9HYME